MRYVNPRTGLTVALDTLTIKEKSFYRRALKEFKRNTDWFEFDKFLFSPSSVLYKGRRSHLEILRHPLFLALKDMWLQLGVQQGKITRKNKRV